MKDTEIISFYNNLDQYAKDKIDRQLIDLTNAKKESRNYCIKVCPKCGAVDPGFTKGGNANSGKPMLKCRCCHKRFTYDNGQLTHYSHQDESKWDQLIVDTFSQVPIEKSAANMNISTYTVWGMCMRLLHMLEKMIADTVVLEKWNWMKSMCLKYVDLLSCKMSRIIYNIRDKGGRHSGKWILKTNTRENWQRSRRYNFCEL